MAHILGDCAKDLTEEADQEREAWETAVKTAKEKMKAAETTEKKAAAAKKNRALAEKRSTELLAKQNETYVKLAEAISLNMTQAEELADLRAALGACEEKWYNEGFADAENSIEPVVTQARKIGFEAGWFAALKALKVLEDSPLRDPSQIPFPSTTAAIQDPPVPIEEEDTSSMRELVEQIDAHAESDDAEATSIPSTQDQLSIDPLFSVADQQQTRAANMTGPST